MATNLSSLTVLLWVPRAGGANTAVNQVTLTISTRSIIVRISVRSALAGLKERRSSSPLFLFAVGERVVADRSGTLVGAIVAVVEERLVAACYYVAGTGAGDGNGVTLDIGDVDVGRVDAV